MFKFSYNKTECPPQDMDKINVLSLEEHLVETEHQHTYVEETEEMTTGFIELVRIKLEEKIKELRGEIAH